MKNVNNQNAYNTFYIILNERASQVSDQVEKFSNFTMSELFYSCHLTVTSNSSLILKARKLKFCIKTPPH